VNKDLKEKEDFLDLKDLKEKLENLDLKDVQEKEVLRVNKVKEV